MLVSDAFTIGCQIQIRRVITALGPERTDKGLNAFEDGAKNWSSCFFAQALPELKLHRSIWPEADIARELGLLRSNGEPNVIPVKLLYTMFDEVAGSNMTRIEMRQLIENIRDESRPKEVLDLLRSLDFTKATAESTKSVFVDVACEVPNGSTATV